MFPLKSVRSDVSFNNSTSVYCRLIEVTVVSKSMQYTDVELLNDTSDATDFNANINAFMITFNADQVANYADATQVYKITVETNDPTN